MPDPTRATLAAVTAALTSICFVAAAHATEAACAALAQASVPDTDAIITPQRTLAVNWQMTDGSVRSRDVAPQ